jgi:hypothetical protein
MHSMAIERRQLLQWLAASGLGAVTPPALAHLHDTAETRFLAARRRAGRYEAVVLDAQGRDRRVLTLPDRGHSFAIDTRHRQAVVFGRQPGFFAMTFDLDSDMPTQTLPLPEGRHYYGHGVYSADGARLYATENDYEAGRGVLGIYAREDDGWRRTGEFDTHGVGPHEVVLMPDGHTLCVANGGILTHPDYGKTELNLDTMAPSLVYLDADSGRLLEQVALAPELHQLSIRHLALDASGAVWFGCQYSGPAADRPALVGRHRRGAAAVLFRGDDETLREMRNYVGSVAVDLSGSLVATSSPVGGQVVYWNARDGHCLGSTALPDGCGVAPQAAGRFLLSDGHGSVVEAGPGLPTAPLLAHSDDLGWDNHLRRV